MKSKLFVTLVGLLMAGLSCLAQDDVAAPVPADSLKEGWNTLGGIGLNFSQVSLSNWAGGGQNSISLGGLFAYYPTLKRGKSVWENGISLAYGVIRQGDSDQNDLRKTDDLINLYSKYNYSLSERWALTAFLDFRTQIAEGFEYPDNNDDNRIKISEFMAPGFLLTSLGVSYSPGPRFSLSLLPVSGKYTFVLDDSLSNAGAFNVNPGDKVRSEFGANLRASYKRDIMDNVNLATNLLLFGNYEEFNHIDVNWDVNLLMKVNKLISATVSSQLVYDHDIIAKTQWRNSITVGLLYNF